MELSILDSTKKVLGIAADYTVFDFDILTYINSAFSNLHDLGVGSVEGVAIEDATAVWGDLGLDTVLLGMVKTFVFLKVRMLFDPPGTSFLIEAVNKQIAEHEWRINAYMERKKYPLVEEVTVYHE